MQIRDFDSKMQQVARKTAPDWKTKKHQKKQNPKKKSSPLIIQFRTVTLQHTFTASDLVPDIFQSNTASRYVFILPTWPFSLQKVAFSQLPHSEVSLVYPSHFHIDSFRSLPFGLKYITWYYGKSWPFAYDNTWWLWSWGHVSRLNRAVSGQGKETEMTNWDLNQRGNAWCWQVWGVSKGADIQSMDETALLEGALRIVELDKLVCSCLFIGFQAPWVQWCIQPMGCNLRNPFVSNLEQDWWEHGGIVCWKVCVAQACWNLSMFLMKICCSSARAHQFLTRISCGTARQAKQLHS